MKHHKLALITLSIVLLLAFTLPAVVAQDNEDDEGAPTPEEVLEQLETAINSGDYEAAAALHDENVIVTYVPAAVFEEPPIVSRQDLLTQLESIREIHPQIEIEIQQVVGDDIVITSTRSIDDFVLEMGLKSLDFTEVYVIRDGLILGTTSVLTSDSLELLMAAMEEMDGEQ